ncbi:glutamine amidotransferase-related protein [Marisediminicola senii]|uniref:glutamine amidotransferase-related protein n=1 Tax=Marisediminicola senii TaxID=2711233 RepID=UPI0013EC5474|nr:glutamine amidotransferase [Marisediminicola senii]
MVDRVALVVQHNEREHLGSFADVLESRGYVIHTVRADLDTAGLAGQDAADADLVVVLGGDQAVYEPEQHPHLADEVGFLAKRLENERATLGVCLGAQLIAEALGGRVSKGKSVVVGFSEVQVTDAGLDSPLRHLVGVSVMQWHGDSFRLPAGATRLASSAEYSNEAFRMGDYALAVQFHPELTGAMFEEWIAAGQDYLAEHGVDGTQLLADRDRLGAAMQAAGQAMLAEWLDAL